MREGRMRMTAAGAGHRLGAFPRSKSSPPSLGLPSVPVSRPPSLPCIYPPPCCAPTSCFISVVWRSSASLTVPVLPPPLRYPASWPPPDADTRPRRVAARVERGCGAPYDLALVHRTPSLCRGAPRSPGFCRAALGLGARRWGLPLRPGLAGCAVLMMGIREACGALLPCFCGEARLGAGSAHLLICLFLLCRPGAGAPFFPFTVARVQGRVDCRPAYIRRAQM
ncbi:hypothetical protein B0H17DRAFT_1032051, partial [Mycena rosella]